MDELACESCHVPQLYAPAVQQVDWTTISADGQPIGQCRGLKGDSGTLKDLITGFQPVLMPRQNVDGDTLLAPYNLVSAWYWVYEDVGGNTRPVRLEDLQAAWLQDGQYSPEVVAAFDQDSDGSLNESELSLDTAEKQALIAARLEALGLRNPHIAGEVQPYSVNHNVAAGEWAIQDCKACHNDTSRVTQPIQLASYLPGGVMPEFVKDANTIANGSLYLDDGALYYQPATRAQKLYIFGHTRISWLDWLGALLFVGVLVGVAGHGTYRFYSSLRAPRNEAHLEKVYMYSVYERFWHWLQTFVIILLLFTGLIIHRPDIFGFFNFRNVVMVHNVLAALLVANAGLALFYHLASGEIRQFIPRPYGFFDQAIVQAKYYLGGIFKGSSHPFEKTPQKKLNPLQQATYFAILNVLLPLQILTGALMWGVQRWPGIANLMGGLPFLAPFHSLVAWLFAAFIVAHVYLTTTGHEPLTSVRAMMNGWDEVEVETAKEETAISTPEEEIKDDHTGDVQAQGAQPEGNPV
jgi:thiosulfate reductase cytochrome b subunit